MTFGFVAFQLILFPIETMVFKWMVPPEFRVDMSVTAIIGGMPELSILFPNSIVDFMLYYGAGFMVVSVLFTAILLERSFRWKGIFAGITYSITAVAVLIAPLLLQDFVLNGFFYPIELFVLELVMGLIVIVASIWMSGYLLTKKITV